MTNVIWKYHLEAHTADILLPSGATVLTARLQHDALSLWVQCDPDAPKVLRTFRCVNTGYDFDDTGLRYIATDETRHGIVWHVYEKENA